MKTKTNKISMPLIVIFYILAIIFFCYAIYMAIYSIGYVNAYNGSTTVAIENSIQYVVSSTALYFGFAFLFWGVAVILNSFNKIRANSYRIDDSTDTENLNSFNDNQMSIDELLQDSEPRFKPEPIIEETYEENIQKPELKPEYEFEPQPVIEEAPDDNIQEPELEPELEFKPQPAIDDAPDDNIQEPEPQSDFEFEPQPIIEEAPEDNIQEPVPQPEPELTLEDDSDDDIVVEQVKLEKRTTPVKRENISSTMIKDIFEKK